MTALQAGHRAQRTRGGHDRSPLVEAALRLEGRFGWAAVLAVAIYILVATTDWHVPDPNGVDFWLVWGILSAIGLIAAQAVVLRIRPAGRGLVRPVEVMAFLAMAGMLATDATIPFSQGLRDLRIYLQAGAHYLQGGQVYMTSVLTAAPADEGNYPFLYPPFTLPFFAALAVLPYWLTAGIWVTGSAGAAVLGLRLIGLRWRWAIAGLLWPPFVAGLWTGNVVVPSFLLFAVGPWLGGTLVLGAAFKAYSGVAGIWLLRERRWRALAAGVGALLAMILVTLPFTGTQLWLDWLHGLELFERSQPLLPDALYGNGLPHYIPRWAYLGLAAAAVTGALWARGRDGLGRLGLASVVAGPSVYSHGFPFALPAMLMLRTPWLWVVLAIMSVSPGPGWWVALLIVAVGWFVPELRRERRDAADPDPLHPLAGERGPWEHAPIED